MSCGRYLVASDDVAILRDASSEDQLMNVKKSTILLTITLTTLAGGALAADGVRVRGKIASIDASTLTVDSREGAPVTIMLKPDWQVSSVAKASAADIKPGDYVGVASLAKANGGDGALEVVIFPAAMKGAGQGSYAWDLEPDSTMTNGTVANAVTQTDGQTLTIDYGGGTEKKVTIAEGTPVVTFAPATKDDLKPGAVVFVPADKAADGSLSTGRIVVGTNGVVPPM